jgi:serine/threonine protein kinase/Flp pilus assembly protein TadD
MNLFDNGSISRSGSVGVATPSEIASWQDDPRVVSALEEYLALLKAGRRPTKQEFLDRHSEIASALGECLDGLEFVQSAVPRLPTVGPVGSEEPLPPATRLGDYRIIHEVGRGGMGIVYEADQISLGRRVALKVLPFAAAIDPRQRQRFQLEAQAAAHLHHAHIVPVFAVGFDQGVHYYAMQFIEGRSLAAVIGELRAAQLPEPPDPPARGADSTITVPPVVTPVPEAKSAPASAGPSSMTSASHRSRVFVRMVAQLGAQAAEALDHAHSLGVVHRDIKPSNLLVDPRGELWITDFGLARFQDDPGPTRTGDLIGTLRYMSPEQALGKRVVVDHRTDIYSLGATLYELLTLRPLFDGRDRQELLRQIALEEPIAPRRVNPAIPRDLETILFKAMEKEAPRRYASAQELAEDLRRFLDDKPIQARRPNALEHAAKWARRHRPIVATATVVGLLAILIGSGFILNEKHKTDVALARVQSLVRDGFLLADHLTMRSMQSAAMHIAAGDMTDDDRQIYDLAQRFYDEFAAQSESRQELIDVTAHAYCNAGFVRMVKGQLAEASLKYQQSKTLFDRAISAAPNDMDLRKKYEQLQAFMNILNMDPKTLARNREAAKKTQLRELADKEAESRAVLAITRLEAALLYDESNRGEDAKRLRNQAREEFQAQAASVSPDIKSRMVGALINKASSMTSGTQRKTCAEVLRLALSVDPRASEALNNLAWLLAVRPGVSPHDPKEATQLAKRALEDNERNWYYWNTLGMASYRAGDYTGAAKAIESSMKLHNGGDPNDWLILALIHKARGDLAEAGKLLGKSHEWLKTHPSRDQELLALDREATSQISAESQ